MSNNKNESNENIENINNSSKNEFSEDNKQKEITINLIKILIIILNFKKG